MRRSAPRAASLHLRAIPRLPAICAARAVATARCGASSRYGVVQLKGVVDNDAQLRAAEAIARNISGVRSVQNDLRVAALRETLKYLVISSSYR